MKPQPKAAKAHTTDLKPIDFYTDAWQKKMKKQGPPPKRLKALFETDYAEFGIARDGRFYAVASDGFLVIHPDQSALLEYCAALTLREAAITLHMDLCESSSHLSKAARFADDSITTLHAAVEQALARLFKIGAHFWDAIPYCA